MAFGTLSACSEQTVTVSYQEYPNAFRNPMKGFREFFAPGIDRVREEYPYPYGSLTKEYMQWNMIEDDANDGVDKIIAYSNHRWKGVEDINVKVIPRVFLVWLEPWHGGKPKDPTNPDDLTGWHWPKGIDPEKGPYKQKPNSVGAYVEEKDKNTPISGGYFDPSFPERVKKLVEKLGQAWDNDPRVAYVEMGIIGEWGEHHDPDLSTYWAPHDEPEHVANRTWIPGMEKILGDAFGPEHVVWCVAERMAAKKEGNRVVCDPIGELAVGVPAGEDTSRLQRLTAFFDSIGFPYVVPADIRTHMWSKLLCNTGCNQAALVFQCDYGPLQVPGKPRDTMIGAMREVAAVANAEGVPLSEKDVAAWVDIIDHLPSNGETSMRQDGKNHRKSEVELFAGTIRRLAAKHGISVPVNDWLYQQIQEMERNY